MTIEDHTRYLQNIENRFKQSIFGTDPGKEDYWISLRRLYTWRIYLTEQNGQIN